jgi:hypothetical protein
MMMNNVNIKKSIKVAWCYNQKKDSIPIIYSYLILIVYIQVLLDNITSALVSLIDHC